MQTWVSSPANNFGIAMKNVSGTDGGALVSRSSALNGQRPRLVMRYHDPGP